MRREEITKGLIQVLDSVESAGIIDALRKSISSNGANNKDLNKALLVSFHKFSLLHHEFNDAAKQLLKIFSIELLADPIFWSQLLTSSSGDGHDSPGQLAMTLYRQLTFIKSEVPKVVGLLAQHSPYINDQMELNENNQKSTKEDLGLLKIILIEEDGQFSTAKRLVASIESIEEIYIAFGKLHNQISIPLGVGSIDSGSDKSLDLFGAATLMKEVRELILSLWDRIVFYREQKQSKQIELIAASLPILEKIRLLEKEKKIGREEAQIIRNGIMNGAKKFIESGTLISEMDNYNSINPRVLMAPPKKLLINKVTSETSNDVTVEFKESQYPDVRNEPQLTYPNEETNENESAYTDADLEKIAELMLAKQKKTKK